MTDIAIYGKSAAGVLTALAPAAPFGMKEEDGQVRVSVRQKDLPKAIAICEQRCYNYKIIGTSFRRAAKKALAFLPLIIASLLAVVSLFVSDAFVWRVEITGAEGALEERVRTVLYDEGAHAAVPRSAIDERALSAALVRLDEVSAASVTLDGSVLRAEVLPASHSAEVSPGGDVLVSSHDCVITRIVAGCGTPKVSPGDVVAKGDVLIEGREYLTADGAEGGETVVRGRAYGRVTFAFSRPLAFGGGLRLTGRRETSTEIGLFGLALGGGGCSFEHYASVTETSRLYPLPVSVARTTYYELDESSLDDEARAFISAKTDELLAAYGAAFSARTEVTERGGVRIMTIYFTGEICVGKI